MDDVVIDHGYLGFGKCAEGISVGKEQSVVNDILNNKKFPLKNRRYYVRFKTNLLFIVLKYIYDDPSK